MDYKKIMNKKAELTLTNVLISILIVVFIFAGSFLYLNTNATKAGITMDSKANDSYSKLIGVQNDIDTNIGKVKDNFNNIKEADNLVQVAINGFKGLGNTLKLLFNFVEAPVKTWQAIQLNLDIVSPWIITLIGIGLLGLMVLLLLKVWSGGSQVI